MERETNSKRKYDLDLLRILAAFSVVLLHTAAQFWYTLDVNGPEWKIANGYDACFRFGVPVFVMISGALWLGEERPLSIKRLYTHTILRLAAVYGVWSCLYGLWEYVSAGRGGMQELARRMVYGKYHLWFLPLIIGIYVLLPVIKSWVQSASKQNLQYFLTLFFLLQILRQTLAALFPQAEWLYLLSLVQVDMVCGYPGYFVLGYYLRERGISQRWERILYAGALPAAGLNVIVSAMQSAAAGTPKEAVYDSYGLFTFWISAALFVFFTRRAGRLPRGERARGLLRELSADTLGVYVLHVGFIEWTARHGLHSRTIPIWAGIPLYALFCFCCCSLLAALLRRLPFVGRYLC